MTRAAETASIEELAERVEDLAERVAERVAEKLTERGVLPTQELLDTAELARRLGRSRDFVYEHATELGAIRLTNGSKPRLTFPWPPPSTELAPDPPEPPELAPRPARRRRQPAAQDLLPIKGRKR